MLKTMLRVIAAGMIVSPTLAAAEPINLKLSFFTSDRSQIYQDTVKPFVDAVNGDDSGLVHIEVYFSGAISGELRKQPELVADGTADLALIVPGQTPDRFYDTSVLELPGLFRNSHEASRVFALLVSERALAGYGDFYVIDAEVSGPENIHSRKPIASIANLKGLTIRVNNPTEAEVLQRLGAIPVLLSINQATEAVSNGTIDGATFPPSMLFEFGIGRVTTHHFMISLGGAPVAMVMNRKKFESLPQAAQSIIRKYGGERVSDYSTKQFAQSDHEVLKTLEADPRRTVAYPDPADAETIRAVYQGVIEQYAGSSEHNRELLARVRAELAKLRTTE
jgi:TRAP-type C4-dicarboxylate transport system substrate-binding protein